MKDIYISTVISGTVIHSNQLGRTLGFATANIVATGLPDVVSLCEVEIDTDKYPAIGTFLPFKGMYEVHLLDRQGDIYGREIQIRLIKKVRENRKFASQVELIAQIRKDVDYARIYRADQNNIK